MGCLEVSICFTVGPLGSEYFAPAQAPTMRDVSA